MENKNTLIALMLMLAVWFGFSFFMTPAPPNTETVQQETSTTEALEPPDSKSLETAFLPPVESPVVSPGETALAREIVVENDLYRAVFSSRGATLISFVTKDYREKNEPDATQVSLVEGTPTLISSGMEGFGFSEDLLFYLDSSSDTLSLSGEEEGRIRFFHQRADGLRLEKIYSFSGNKYPFQLQVVIINNSSQPLRGRSSLALSTPWSKESKPDSFTFVGPVTFVDDDIKTDDPDDLLKEPLQYADGVKWSAYESKYFIQAVVPLSNSVAKVQVDQVNGNVRNIFESTSSDLSVGQTLSQDFLLYFGPRDLDILNEVNYDLAKAIDFGFFTPIAKPLLYVLKFFYSFFGNYGVSIILLTLIIKLLFWPLTHKSYASMKDMQKLQPEMQKIREKFKNDRERQNRELMELYKTHRVNPLGGCLPMVVQIPVFFALYKVLMDAIELRQAPFALWITDLSLKDPYYVTPLIMGATMFIQQKLTPSTMDPTQAKIFMLMPIIFTFLFLNFPSGLVLYWLVNNLLTILQQYIIHKKPSV